MQGFYAYPAIQEHQNDGRKTNNPNTSTITVYKGVREHKILKN